CSSDLSALRSALSHPLSTEKVENHADSEARLLPPIAAALGQAHPPRRVVQPANPTPRRVSPGRPRRGPGPSVPAPIAEVPDPVPEPPGFRFRAGLDPSRGPRLPARGAVDEPLERSGVPPHDHQRVTQVHRVVGAETELAARLE